MATEAQIQANQQNAQKSTGPRSEQGKNKSRQNSLKHGLTGAAIVQPEGSESDLLKIRVQQWLDDLRPQTATEEWLITTAAVASARIDRCTRHETAALDHRLRHLPATRQKQKAEALAALLENLPKNPEKTQPALLESAPGTRYLLSRWNSLRDSITPQQNHPQTDLRPLLHDLTQLLGHPPFSHWQGRPLEELARLVLATLPDDHLTPALIQHTFHLYTTPTTTENPRADFNLPPREPAQKTLLAFLDAQITDLETHLETLEDIEAHDDDEAADLALFDPSPEAARLHRYEATLYRQLNQCLIRLEKLRNNSKATNTPQTPAPTTSYELEAPPQKSTTTPPNPTRQNEPNFPLLDPTISRSSFVDITVGTPPAHKIHAPNRRS